MKDCIVKVDDKGFRPATEEEIAEAEKYRVKIKELELVISKAEKELRGLKTACPHTVIEKGFVYKLEECVACGNTETFQTK